MPPHDFQGQELGEGIVLDVNSLYPYVMYTQNLPYGEGVAFYGRYETDPAYPIYVQAIKCNFELKENYLPTIQIKQGSVFNPREYLESSDGEDVTLYLTSVDLEVFFKHYNVYNLQYIGGWKFQATVGLFKDYIDKWYGIKQQASQEKNEALRTLAKLMLNALYGKFALSPNVQSKYPVYADGRIKYVLGPHETRKPIYIPMGVFITSYARYKTITSAQKVYDRFAYSDTDSLHLVGTELPDLDIDPYRLGAWKHESTFTRAKFIRAKSYAELIDDKLHITCAGMPNTCHDRVSWENFQIGSSFPGKLVPRHVKGGIVLEETSFTIKG